MFDPSEFYTMSNINARLAGRHNKLLNKLKKILRTYKTKSAHDLFVIIENEIEPLIEEVTSGCKTDGISLDFPPNLKTPQGDNHDPQKNTVLDWPSHTSHLNLCHCMGMYEFEMMGNPSSLHSLTYCQHFLDD